MKILCLPHLCNVLIFDLVSFLRFLSIDSDFDFQSSSAPEFSFCVCPVFVIPRYIAAITITATTNTNTHKTIVYFDNNLDDIGRGNDDEKTALTI